MIGEQATDTNILSGSPCPHPCGPCMRMQLQLKWLLSGGGLLIATLVWITTQGMIIKEDVQEQARVSLLRQQEITFITTGIEDIRHAVGLEVRMPPGLELLKGASNH